MNTATSDLSWYLNASKDKPGQIWSAVRDEDGIGRPPWTAGDETTQGSFDLFVEHGGNNNRQYLFLPTDHPGPDEATFPRSRKDAPMPFKFVDYVNLMPGQPMKRPSAEDRERISKMAEDLKDFAEKQGVQFVITKGDKS